MTDQYAEEKRWVFRCNQINKEKETGHLQAQYVGEGLSSDRHSQYAGGSYPGYHEEKLHKLWEDQAKPANAIPKMGL